jgi:ribose transport system substrate-binding protein
MQDNDVQTQISLVEKAEERGDRAIILSPIATLPVLTPVRRLLARGTPVVVVGTELGIEPQGGLTYILSDEEAAGQMAARRLGAILHEKGSIAILGIDPRLSSMLSRQRSLENTLAQEFPRIHVEVRRLGLANVPGEQQVAEDLLSNHNVDAILALSLASTRGAYYALVEFRKEKTIKLVGFDQDLLLPIRTGGIDSVVAQNTYAMGSAAMRIVSERLRGVRQPAKLVVKPVLITQENIDSAEIHRLLDIRWWSP